MSSDVVMIRYEVVVREKPRRTVYLRRAPDRSFDASSIWRKINMLRFAKINYENYKMRFEDRIEKVRREMRPVKPADITEITKETIYLTPQEYAKIKIALLRKGIYEDIEKVLGVRVVVVSERVKKLVGLVTREGEKKYEKEIAGLVG